MTKSEVKAKLETEGVRNIILNALPQNITNGDVIKAMFPNSRVDISCARAFFYIREDLKMFVTFDINWWNAKYKAENED